MDKTVKTGKGEYDLAADIKLVGNDILIAVYGGEKPHIGAVAVAQPRQSLKDPDIIRSTSSVFCFLSHKEDEIARRTSEAVSAHFKTNVVVTAGMHWDNLSDDSIEEVVNNSISLIGLIKSGIEALIHK